MRTQTWNPWSVFDELERAMFAGSRSSVWPAFDIEDSESEVVLTADLPGLTEQDLDITVQGSTLIVRGERRPVDDRTYLRRERFYGPFEKRFEIGPGYDLESVRANVAHGVLTITVAKAAQAKPRKIKLGAGVVDRVKGLLSGDKDKHQAA
jgi:HSP20 family molecular chaperone IbpA